MKTDRFVKVMLVIMAGLLLLNCFNSGSGIFPPKAQATAPAFLEVGKFYTCVGEMTFIEKEEIVKIDKESGWIQTKDEWKNTAHVKGCSESNQQSKNTNK